MHLLTNEGVNASSLRKTGEEIGISHSTLDTFLTGTTPPPRVRAILCEWYTKRTGDTGDPRAVSLKRAEAAVRGGADILMRFYPEEHRGCVRERLLAAGFVERGVWVPVCLEDEVGPSEGRETEGE